MLEFGTNLTLCVLFACRALQEAQDIFGVDFNFDEFEQYGDEYEEDEDEEEEEVSFLNEIIIRYEYKDIL